MKILYDTSDGSLRTYPRGDDEEVIGLDPRYRALELIQQPQPEITAGQALNPTETIDLQAGTVTRGYDVINLTKQWANVQAFMAAFTDVEKAAISLSTDPTIAGLLLTLTTWQATVQPDDVHVITGLNQLVTLGILTDTRKAEILATAAF